MLRLNMEGETSQKVLRLNIKTPKASKGEAPRSRHRLRGGELVLRRVYPTSGSAGALWGPRTGSGSEPVWDRAPAEIISNGVYFNFHIWLHSERKFDSYEPEKLYDIKHREPSQPSQKSVRLS